MSSRSVFILFFCAFLAHGNPVFPQRLKHLNVENGLSNNYVKDIVQDRRGGIWVATVLGLNYFDGIKFTVYNNINSSLPSNALNSLYYDEPNDKLWIGSISGLCVLDCATKTFETIVPPDDIVIHNVVGLSKASDGGIWIVNHTHGVVHYDPGNGLFTSYTSETVEGLRNRNWCAFDDGYGNLYVGHSQDGVSIVDLKSRTARRFEYCADHSSSLPSGSVYVICSDNMGNIWMGTKLGLVLFNPKTETFLNFNHDPANSRSMIADPVYDMSVMADGTLWLAHDIGGISILDLGNITFKDSKDVEFVTLSADGEDAVLSSNNIRSLLQDVYGNIWIGNYSSGLDFISHTPPVFRVLSYTDEGSSLRNKPVFSIHEDSEGRLWLGSDNEFALFRDDKLMRIFDISGHSVRPHTQIFAMQEDGEGNLLLGMYDDGLLRFDMAKERFERIRLGIENVDIITFFKDRDQKIWIGTEYGIYTYHDRKIEKQEEINSKLNDRSVYGILRDRQGKMWIGTYGGGVSILNSEGRLITTLHLEDGFFSNDVNSLYMDRAGGVWVATRDGLGYIKDTENPTDYEQYNHLNGLTDNFIRSINEDSDGNMWITTNSTISHWNAAEARFDNYDHRDGIPTGNFIEGATSRSHDGTLYFGSLSGVCRFDPRELSKERKVAPVQILNVVPDTQNNDPVITKYPFVLPYNQNTFRISFSVRDYSQNGQVEYAWLMDNLDDYWHTTEDENQVTFRNIAPGSYTFKVKARLRYQEWDEQNMATMSIRILHPLWSTWYAKTLYILIAILSAYGVIRFYKSRLDLKSSLEIERRNSQNEQNLNQERLRFYTNIAHELRTPLTLIIGPLEDLSCDRMLPDPYGHKIQLISDNATRLLTMINQILEFRKTETQNRTLCVVNDDLGRLVTEIGLRYKELNRNEKVTYRISIETDRTTLRFDSGIITTILNNLLSNALKYTSKGEISLILAGMTENGEHYTEIRVSDTGHGIDSDSLPRIFDRYYQAQSPYQVAGTGIGLALVKSLAELHEGVITVESKEGEGTTFALRLLTDNNYKDALREERRSAAREHNPKDPRPVILIVEDNDDIRRYIVDSFAEDYKILSAADGKEGLELARKYIPDIIVSDVMMPGMDGIELCRRIKEDLKTSHILIVLLTAKDAIRDKEEGYDSGADSYLTKPFSSKLLHSRIENLLEARRRSAQLILSHTGNDRIQKTPHNPKIGKLDEEFIKRITSLIEANISNSNLDMAFLTSQFNMSQSTLYRKISSLTGISPNVFIRKLRLKNSIGLLVTGTHNISEAAYDSGFNDIGYFRECFKEEFGITPSEYIRNHIS
jgi:ligand-binding sensor domain-containing protein/signal transduction histidine kinase/DNA-binding response OmpR family regulator